MTADRIATNGYLSTDLAVLQIAPSASFPIVRCADCGFVYAQLLLPWDTLSQIYDQLISLETDLRHETHWSMVHAYLGMWSSLIQSANLASQTWPVVKVLDYGGGYGTFLHLARGPRIEVYGYETSIRRAAYMRERTLSVLGSVADLRQHAPYHFLLCNQVLEHVPNPRDVLALFAELLHPEGRMYVSVPHYDDDVLARTVQAYQGQGSYPLDLNPWEHLNYFSPAHFTQLIAQQGLTIYAWPLIVHDVTDHGIIAGYASSTHPQVAWTTAIIGH